MAMFQGLFLLAVGIILLAIDYQSLSRGWLPFGSNGFKGRLEIQRDDNPAGFWLAFGFYALGGLGITIYGLLVLAGVCPALPLRGSR